jgi:hypothetical protein
VLWKYKLVEVLLHTFLASSLNGSALEISDLKKIYSFYIYVNLPSCKWLEDKGGHFIGT